MTTVLVTGAAGFVGRHFLAALRAERPDVRVIGLDRDADIGVCDRRVVCDLAQPAAISVIHALEPLDCVVHLAAQSYVHFSVARPDLYVRDNVLATANLAYALAEHPSLQRFLQVSSCEVYGNTAGVATETAAVNPRTPYAATKLAQEHMALSAIEHQKLPAVVCRLFNNFGEGQQANRLLPRIFHAMDRDRRFELTGSGDQTRDWTAVEDTCRALTGVALGDAIDVGAIYNVTAEQVYSIRQIIEMCETAAQRTLLVQQINKDAGHLQKSAGSAAALRSAIGWRPSRLLADYIDDTFSRFQSR